MSKPSMQDDQAGSSSTTPPDAFQVPAVENIVPAAISPQADRSESPSAVVCVDATPLASTATPQKRYDVFMCHNRAEKALVKDIADALQIEAGLLFFLDEYSIPASVEFMEFIEAEMRASGACAIFMGPAGWGATHIEEARLARRIRDERNGFRIIPVMLPGAHESDWRELFDTMPDVNWVDFAHATHDEPRRKLIEAVQGNFTTRASGPEAVTPYYVRRQAALWERTNQKDSSLLLRGLLLRQAQALAAENPIFVSVQAVPAFLARSAQAERNRLRVGIVISVGVTIVTAVLGAFAWTQRDRALVETERARAQAEIALSRSLAAIAPQSVGNEREDERAALLVRQAYLIDQVRDGASRPMVEAALRNVLGTPNFGSVYGRISSVGQPILSPDAAWLLVPGPSWQLIGPVVRPDGRRAEDRIVDLGAGVRMAAFLPGAEGHLAVLASDNRLELRSVTQPTQAQWRSSDLNAEFVHLAISPDSSHAALVSDSGRALVIEVGSDGRPVNDWVLPIPVEALALGAGGRMVAAQERDSSRLLAFFAGKTKPVGFYPGQATAFAFVPGRDELVVGEHHGDIVRWIPSQLNAPTVPLGRAPNGAINTIAVSADGRIAATASASIAEGVHFWNIDSGGEAAPTIPGLRAVAMLGMSEDGRFLVSVTVNGDVRYWRLRGTGVQAHARVNDHQRLPFSPILFGIVRMPDPDRFVVGGSHGALQIWTAMDQPPTILSEVRAALLLRMGKAARPTQPEAHIMAIAVAASGGRVATADAYGTALVWNTMAMNSEPRFIAGGPGSRPAFSVALSPSGRRLLVAGTADDMRLHTLDEGGAAMETLPLSMAGGHVVRAALFLNEDTLLVGDDAGRLVRWSLRNSSTGTVIAKDGGGIRGLTLLPDGRVGLARGSSVEIGDAGGPAWTSTVLSTGIGETSSITASPDGTLVAAGYVDGAIRMWDMHGTGAPTLVAGAHRGSVRALGFDAAGTTLMSGGDDGMLRSWTTGVRRLADIVCAVVWRDLTPDEGREYFAPFSPREPTCP